MAQSYQILARSSDVDGHHLTVRYADDVTGASVERRYSFTAPPAAGELADMLAGDGKRLLAEAPAAAAELPAPGAPKPIA